MKIQVHTSISTYAISDTNLLKSRIDNNQYQYCSNACKNTKNTYAHANTCAYKYINMYTNQ